MQLRIDPDELLEYLIRTDENDIPILGSDTKLYLGGDSERFRRDGVWFADYIIVCVVHINGCSGCKIFGEVTRERDYDQRKDRPAQRLMTEVYKITEMYERLKDVIEASGFDLQIHIDLNPKKTAGSSCVINEAIGYVQGQTGITPIPKPDAFAASYAADRYKETNALKNADLKFSSKRKMYKVMNA